MILNPLKVLIIIDSLSVGGRERRLVELLKGISSFSRIKIHLILLKDFIGYPEVNKLSNVEISIFKRRIKKDPFVFHKIYRTCRHFKPNLIHSWGSMSSVYAIPAAKILGIPFINAMISDARCEIWGKTWWRSKLTFPFSDLIVSNSSAGQEAYHVNPAKGRIVRNGFYFERILHLTEATIIRQKFDIQTTLVVGMVGAFHPRKDYSTFLEAAKTILNRRNDISFIAIGDGPEWKKLAPVAESKYKDYIHFTGHQSDVESLINIFNIGVLMSNPHVHQEGISNAIMEYMALGKPVIATRGGGTEEIVRDGFSGFIINPFSKDELVEKIEYLADHMSHASEMGRNGRKIIEEAFSLTKMVKTTLNLYYEAIHIKKPASAKVNSEIWQ
jgi:glycosyltransferase involved in cell wall biosynthesis